MIDELAPIVFGWPAVILGESAFLVGLGRRDVALAVFGLVVAAPFFVYISMNPAPFRFLGFLCLATNALALVVRLRGRANVAGLLAAPALMLLGYFAIMVLRQPAAY